MTAPQLPPFPPIEPPRSTVVFPDPRRLGAGQQLVGVSRAITPGMALSAYRRGIFPWPVEDEVIPWASPAERAVFPLDRPPEWPRNVRKAINRARSDGLLVTVDVAFERVMGECAGARPEGTWITTDLTRTYVELHRLGWAHSVEVWAGPDLIGGLYGMALGALFAGESMFHRRTDASKVAFVALVDRLRARGFELLDAQVMNPHLENLGCVEIPRDEYLDRLPALAARPVRFAG